MSPTQVPGITVDQHGRVLLATIDGGSRGEFGREIAADLAALVGRAEKDDSVGAVVLTGAHPERFVAHADLTWLQEGGASSPSVGPRGASRVMRAARAGRRIRGVRRLLSNTPLSGAMELAELHETLLRMNTCGAVFIAAINGSALGIGSELALACDYRFMARGDFVIGQPEILLGFPPAGGGTQRLLRLLGPAAGLKIVLEGASLSPESAQDIGYVDETTDPDELVGRALAHATQIAGRIKPAVAAVKRSVYLGSAADLVRGMHQEQAEFLSTISKSESQQAMLAYIRATELDGDLPLYNPEAYARSQRVGRFS